MKADADTDAVVDAKQPANANSMRGAPNRDEGCSASPRRISRVELRPAVTTRARRISHALRKLKRGRFALGASLMRCAS